MERPLDAFAEKSPEFELLVLLQLLPWKIGGLAGAAIRRAPALCRCVAMSHVSLEMELVFARQRAIAGH